MTYVGLVQICSLLHQHLRHFGMTMVRSPVQRGAAIILKGVIQTWHERRSRNKEDEGDCNVEMEVNHQVTTKSQPSHHGGKSGRKIDKIKGRRESDSDGRSCHFSATYISAIDVHSLIDGLVHDVQLAVLGSLDEVFLKNAHGCRFSRLMDATSDWAIRQSVSQ